MKRLFGTDGIRGVAGEPPLDPATVRKFGVALAEVLVRATGHAPRVVLGRDTRESGTWLRDAVADGLEARGAAAADAGVLSTPGLAFVAKGDHFDAGVMISASHNPFEDNGLKVFSTEGVKLADALEHDVEERILDPALADPGAGRGTAHPDPALVTHYLEHLAAEFGSGDGVAGRRLVLDCANGAAAALAPDLYRRLGAEVETLGTAPDGRNINLGCGSLHLDALAERVREGGFDLGLAFDGDADRCLAVDRGGRVVDGDHILYLAARALKRDGALSGSRVVATIMSNFWLEKHLADEGVTLLRAPVGDKYVLERMVEEGAVLGGEQSGHVIFRHLATTGDGMLTGLALLRALAGESDPLEAILDRIRPYPQRLVNVRVKEKPDLRAHPAIGPEVEAAERALDGSGRIVLRYSGTERLARVMVEAEREEDVAAHVERLADVIRREIGE